MMNYAEQKVKELATLIASGITVADLNKLQSDGEQFVISLSPLIDAIEDSGVYEDVTDVSRGDMGIYTTFGNKLLDYADGIPYYRVNDKVITLDTPDKITDKKVMGKVIYQNDIPVISKRITSMKGVLSHIPHTAGMDARVFNCLIYALSIILTDLDIPFCTFNHDRLHPDYLITEDAVSDNIRSIVNKSGFSFNIGDIIDEKMNNKMTFSQSWDVLHINTGVDIRIWNYTKDLVDIISTVATGQVAVEDDKGFTIVSDDFVDWCDDHHLNLLHTFYNVYILSNDTVTVNGVDHVIFK